MSTSTEQRVLSTKPKIGARPTAGGAAEEPAAPPAKGKKSLLMMVVVAVLVLGGAGYWFLMGPGAGEKTEEATPAPVPGEVLTVDPVSINLADGHYLRLGLGLQLIEEVHSPVSPAHALDLAIALYSGRTVEEVTSAEGRAALKAELKHQIDEAYHHDVMDVYLTDYVTQ